MNIKELENDFLGKSVENLQSRYGKPKSVLMITARNGKWYQTSIGSCSLPHIVAYRGKDGLERYKNVKLS